MASHREPLTPLRATAIPCKPLRYHCKQLRTTNVLNDSFTYNFGISFQESYQKCYKFEKKPSLEEKRNTKCAIIRETVSKISEDNISTAVDRLYGARQSLQSWDADRKQKNHLNLPRKQKSEPQLKNLKLTVV